jgi:hypothetical protein
MKAFLVFLICMWGTTLSAQIFSESPQTFLEVSLGAVAFADIDGDGDNDLLVTGADIDSEHRTILYSNQDGIFTANPDVPFPDLLHSTITFFDLDADADPDLLLTGETETGDRVAQLYTNEGGQFTEVLNTPFDGVYRGSVATADIDGDSDLDLFITGANPNEERIAKLYTNQDGSFTEVLNTSFEGVLRSSVAFADIDGDDDPDLLITGTNSSDDPITKLYTNQDGSFSEVPNTPFPAVDRGAVAFADIDGDTDPDLVLTGWGVSSFLTILYHNEGGVFTEVSNTPLLGVVYSSVAFADVDNDGDPDLLIMGAPAAENPFTRLYTNEAGVFTEVSDTPFFGGWLGSVAFADVDGDGDLDLYVTGADTEVPPLPSAHLYINENPVSNLIPVNSLPPNDLWVFPNPSDGNFTVRLPEPLEDATLRLTDAAGRLVLEHHNSRLTDWQCTENLAAGVYTLSIEAQGRLWVERVVVW